MQTTCRWQLTFSTMQRTSSDLQLDQQQLRLLRGCSTPPPQQTAPAGGQSVAQISAPKRRGEEGVTKSAGEAAASQDNKQQISDHGHYFTKRTFSKFTYCHHCADMLWGLISQGFICEVCNFVVHERCLRLVVSHCSTVAASAIKNPMPHCWIEAQTKRKFCNVCRKRIDDSSSAIRCSTCSYCVHSECQEFSISDCRECATYVPDQALKDVVQLHHWREGNLPQSSKCHWCRKSCFSAECLTGMRCEWCDMTVHASCLRNVSRECNLGGLKSIILPPSCVSIPRTDVPMETIICAQNRYNTFVPQQQQQQQPSQSQAQQQPATPNNSSAATFVQFGAQADHARTVRREKDEDAGFQQQEDLLSRDNEELVRVFDGNGAIKKRAFRLISVHKSASGQALVAACLRRLHIHDDVAHYALFDISDGTEREMSGEQQPLLSFATQASGASGGGKRQAQRSLSVLLRYRPPDSSKGSIRVYPGRLNVSELTYCKVPVTSDTSVHEVMQFAVESFKLPTEPDLARYRLVEVSLDKGSSVHERTMDNQECPWEIIKNVARESVRQKENTRFYLQQQDEVYCSSVAIFVGNLPPNRPQKQYESILLGHLGKPYRFKQMNTIYYEHGSCIITYDNADIAVKAFYKLRESSITSGSIASAGGLVRGERGLPSGSGAVNVAAAAVDGVDSNSPTRGLLVLLLPNIVPEIIPTNSVRPLLVFVNVKSGGCQGLNLITTLRRLLNPYQVYDLENGGPLPGLYVFRKVPDYKILVSGGDGSVGWVLQCLDNVGQDSECQSPPCAIIPLGTGNDLARVLRWGSGYAGAEDPINFLKDIVDAEEVVLDRWTVVFHLDEAASCKQPDHLALLSGKAGFGSSVGPSSGSGGSGAEDNAAIFVMNNYLGIGLDADLCLGFHNAREENPDKFNSRFHNKGVYVRQAIRKIVNKNSWTNLNKAIRLEVDGKPISLPHIEGLIILNILSWGSGANPWGPEVEDRFKRPTHHDGMLEVVGVTGIVHLGQIQSGLSRAVRIAQGGRIKIRLNTEMPIQVDGEPWIQAACEVNIIKSALKATMLRRIKMRRRNTEPSINQEIERTMFEALGAM